jgi:hypothetical protein
LRAEGGGARAEALGVKRQSSSVQRPAPQMVAMSAAEATSLYGYLKILEGWGEVRFQERYYDSLQILERAMGLPLSLTNEQAYAKQAGAWWAEYWRADQESVNCWEGEGGAIGDPIDFRYIPTPIGGWE